MDKKRGAVPIIIFVLFVSIVTAIYALNTLELAKLTASDGGTRFGFYLAVSGDTVAVGSEKAVYIFQRSGRRWVEVAKLTASDGSYGDGFGHHVDSVASNPVQASM